MVYDCGTHVGPASRAVSLPARALAGVAYTGPPIGTLTVSHLHWDHYSGFLHPVGNLTR